LKLVAAGLPPTAAARQVGLGRSTVYRELRHTGADRLTAPVTPTFAEGSPLALSAFINQRQRQCIEPGCRLARSDAVAVRRLT
jgi:hypothetical protein